VLETVGTQEYKLLASDLIGRIGETYGDAAVRSVESRPAGL
jgi:adenosine kinase